jgi:flavin reductase (DIM6/NTAB) family NADH-FMN oxidoreductase RutF
MAKKTLALSKVYQLLEQGPVTMVTTAYKGRPNVMTMSWHMMIDFEPPICACVISDQNYTFDIIKKTKECVINIPTVDGVQLAIDVGNVSGRDVNKFERFTIKQEPASTVDAPLLSSCYANLECKVIDTKMVKKYNISSSKGCFYFCEILEKYRYRSQENALIRPNSRCTHNSVLCTMRLWV